MFSSDDMRLLAGSILLSTGKGYVDANEAAQAVEDLRAAFDRLDRRRLGLQPPLNLDFSGEPSPQKLGNEPTGGEPTKASAEAAE